MSATDTQLPIARLLHPISGEGEQEWPDFLLVAREQLSETGRLSDRLAAAGWQITLHHDGEILELVARKRHHTLRAAIDELRALEATGSVYLDAHDECSTLAYADLAQPNRDHQVDDPPAEGEQLLARGQRTGT